MAGAVFAERFLDDVMRVAAQLDGAAIEQLAAALAAVRARGGRLFLLGVGGSAASCSHAVNDFRKLCGFEAYAPTDNVAELTARTNDEGWETVFVEWLRGARLRRDDAVLVMSVGGGNAGKNISANLVRALQYAKDIGATITGVVGRDGGYTAQVGDAVVLVPTVNAEHITPLTEAFHSVITHLLVTHPALKTQATKWESVR